MGRASATNSYTEGNGLSASIAGIEGRFMVHTKDQYGNPYFAGGAPISLKFTGILKTWKHEKRKRKKKKRKRKNEEKKKKEKMKKKEKRKKEKEKKKK